MKLLASFFLSSVVLAVPIYQKNSPYSTVPYSSSEIGGGEQTPCETTVASTQSYPNAGYSVTQSAAYGSKPIKGGHKSRSPTLASASVPSLPSGDGRDSYGTSGYPAMVTSTSCNSQTGSVTYGGKPTKSGYKSRSPTLDSASVPSLPSGSGGDNYGTSSYSLPVTTTPCDSQKTPEMSSKTKHNSPTFVGGDGHSHKSINHGYKDKKANGKMTGKGTVSGNSSDDCSTTAAHPHASKGAIKPTKTADANGEDNRFDFGLHSKMHKAKSTTQARHKGKGDENKSSGISSEDCDTSTGSYDHKTKDISGKGGSKTTKKKSSGKTMGILPTAYGSITTTKTDINSSEDCTTSTDILISSSSGSYPTHRGGSGSKSSNSFVSNTLSSHHTGYGNGKESHTIPSSTPTYMSKGNDDCDSTSILDNSSVNTGYLTSQRTSGTVHAPTVTGDGLGRVIGSYGSHYKRSIADYSVSPSEQPSNAYESPKHNSDGNGKSKKPSHGGGKSKKPSSDYGNSKQPSGSNGKPKKSPNGGGKSKQPSGDYGNPNQPSSGSGSYHKRANNYNLSPTTNGDYGSPKKPSSGSGTPTQPSAFQW
ncbi:hypothetical protein K7432_004669 [Basidiobolus ranarum]|uniref:Uncharacterized protein n=1 Tax=Basidiobolus ranarum TaxID=34480 RepID=A0ABR2WXQ7_9FUNG